MCLYVRSTIVCRGQQVTSDTATDALINDIAANMAGNKHTGIAGYDAATVRAILLDMNVTASLEAPAAYAGK